MIGPHGFPSRKWAPAQAVLGGAARNRGRGSRQASTAVNADEHLERWRDCQAIQAGRIGTAIQMPMTSSKEQWRERFWFW